LTDESELIKDAADPDADAAAAQPDAFDAEGEPRLRTILSFVGRSARRIGVTVGGFVLLLVGLAGLALPIIPGIPLIIAGLALLASEYAWARRALERARARAMQAVKKVRRSAGSQPTDA
jgi:Putative transmembrane protein (PGPGW)